MRYRLTLREIIDAHPPAKRAEDRGEPMVYFIARPLSFPLGWLALRFGMHPNDVSVIALLANLAGLGLMASGNRTCMLAGVVTVFVALVFDCVDGTMARATRQFTGTGAWIDALSAYLLYAGFHLAGGVGAWLALTRGAPVTHWPQAAASGGVLVVAGAIASAVMSFAVLANGKLKALFPQLDRYEVIDRTGRGFYGLAFTVARNLSFPSGLVIPITFVGIALRRYDVVLIGYAALNVVMAAAVVLRAAASGRRQQAAIAAQAALEGSTPTA